VTEFLIFAALLLIILAFAVGRLTANKVEKLNNEEVLQERDRIRSDIEAQQEELAKARENYQALKTQTDAEQDKAQIFREQRESERQELERQKETREQELNSLFTEKERAMEARCQEKQERIRQAVYNLRFEKQIEADQVRAELNSLKATRDAAIEAAKKEREIADSPQDHSVNLTEDEAHDINYLNDIRSRLFFPQVVGKAIWSTFLQKKMKALSVSLLGTEKVCGVYKITDQLTGECYVGQSVDCQKRWSDHVKCGVGATPISAGNLLYAAMVRDGIENFTFELLEDCPASQLNEKEAFYIELYSADKVGLNSKGGNGKPVSEKRQLDE